MSRKSSLFLFLFLTLLALPVISYSQSANDGFNPNAGAGSVNSIAVQSDGKILIGCNLVYRGGVLTGNYIARLKLDGSLDTTFNPNANGAVRCIEVQADGRVLMGGLFTTIGGVARNYIARLKLDGSLDTTFNPNANDPVVSIAVQPDGKILIGGLFTTVAGEARNSIARLNPDGSVDTTFNPNGTTRRTLPGIPGSGNVNGSVGSIGIQTDGKVLIGGSFATIGGVARNNIARLNPNGSLDTTFNPNANGPVSSIAVQADGKILIGGLFTTIDGVARNRIARLNPDGNLDTSFNPSANGDVYRIAVQPDGKILIGGLFNTIDGVARNRIARLNQNGSLDTTFNPNANAFIASIAVQSDGKLLIGGAFTTIAGVTRNLIARLYPDGSLDADLNPKPDGIVSSMAVQADGKILVGGYFNTISGVTRTRIARLNPDGNVDAAFNPNVNGTVSSIAVQADGKILVGGVFTTIAGGARNSIARLKLDGSLDTTFNPNANGPVNSIAVQVDGKILIGGEFTTIGGVARNYIARLNQDGNLDSTFIGPYIAPIANGRVLCIAIQTDGKVLIGGLCSGGVRNYIARLDSNGSLDTTFNPSPDGWVTSIAVLTDGKILIGGVFSAIGGVARNRIARLKQDGNLDTTFIGSYIEPILQSGVNSIAIQTDGKIMMGGSFITWVTKGGGGMGRPWIARLNPNGSLDTNFNPYTGKNIVRSVTVQADGKTLIGGRDYSTDIAVVKGSIARLTNTDAALQELKVSPTGDTVTWLRGGASPEVWRVTFEHSSDGITWSSLGNGTRWKASMRTLPGIPGSGIGITGGWQLTGLSLPFNQNHYVRARGYAFGGMGNGSSSLFESVRMFYNPQVAGPDLIETAVSNPPASATAGSSFSVTDTVKNQGNATAVPSLTRYYLSLDTTKGSGDVLLTGNRPVLALGVNGTNSGNVTVTIPSNTPSGSYYLLACADDTQVIAEGNEALNCMASTSKINVTAVAPDLIETAVGNPPWNANAGSSFSVWDTVKNQGNASAPASITRYYLSLDTSRGSGDVLLTGSRSVPALGVNGTNSGNVTVTIPSNTPSGSYYLLACADDTQVVAEGNETNNCKASTYKVNLTGVGVPASPSGVVAPQPPTLVSPSGTITTRTPTYTWNAVGNAAAYQLAVDDSSGVRIRQWYSAETCGCGSGTGTCSATPAISLNLGTVHWWVQTSNAAGSSPWSAVKFFTIQSP